MKSIAKAHGEIGARRIHESRIKTRVAGKMRAPRTSGTAWHRNRLEWIARARQFQAGRSMQEGRKWTDAGKSVAGRSSQDSNVYRDEAYGEQLTELEIFRWHSSGH